MPRAFQWDASYVIDGGQVDEEHKHLLELANRVLRLDGQGLRLQDVSAVVTELYRYMEEHFEHEEALMARVDFPGYYEHVLLHQQLIADMNRLLRSCSRLDEFCAKLKDAMADWVIEHIVRQDVKIRDYVRQCV